MGAQLYFYVGLLSINRVLFNIFYLAKWKTNPSLMWLHLKEVDVTTCFMLDCEVHRGKRT